MLPAWRPVPSFGSTMIIFGIFGLIFLTLGITLYVMSEKIQGVVYQYDKCSTAPTTCTSVIEIDSDIPAPIYVYYQLDNFYQNHRRYVKSRSNEQLMGNELSVSQLSDCDPITTNANLATGKILAYDKTTELKGDDPAFPCGLVAKSYFNDTFELWTMVEDQPSENITIADNDIAWDSDVKYKFKNLPGDWESKQWTDIENRKLHSSDELIIFFVIEHFIVWMRTAGLPNFRKLYGKVTEDLKKGKYELKI